jgi:hypothetical protein
MSCRGLPSPADGLPQGCPHCVCAKACLRMFVPRCDVLCSSVRSAGRQGSRKGSARRSGFVGTWSRSCHRRLLRNEQSGTGDIMVHRRPEPVGDSPARRRAPDSTPFRGSGRRLTWPVRRVAGEVVPIQWSASRPSRRTTHCMATESRSWALNSHAARPLLPSVRLACLRVQTTRKPECARFSRHMKRDVLSCHTS